MFCAIGGVCGPQFGMTPVNHRQHRTKRLRNRLWAANCRCYWCGLVTYLPDRDTLKAMPGHATIDHVKCKAQCVSNEEYRSKANLVLACHRCNQRRNDEFQQVGKIPAKNHRAEA